MYGSCFSSISAPNRDYRKMERLSRTAQGTRLTNRTWKRAELKEIRMDLSTKQLFHGSD